MTRERRGGPQPASASAGLSVRPGGAPPSQYAREVLDLVDTVPAGGAVTYGEVAELHGRGSARTVGTVMSRHGRETAWWRVVQADGRPAEPYVREALGRLRSEGCPLIGERVDLAACGGADTARTRPRSAARR